MEEEHTKEPSHNNPEEAANYVKAVNTLLQSYNVQVYVLNYFPSEAKPQTLYYPIIEENIN